jgi:hypothetical protein
LYQPGQILDSCKQPNSYAISFDDGPGQLTEELLDFLDEQQLKVTFFMNGDNWKCIYSKLFPILFYPLAMPFAMRAVIDPVFSAIYFFYLDFSY